MLVATVLPSMGDITMSYPIAPNENARLAALYELKF